MIYSNNCSLLYRINQFLFIMEPDCNFYYTTLCSMCEHNEKLNNEMVCKSCQEYRTNDTSDYFINPDELPF